MSVAIKVLKHEINDLRRSRWVLGYGLLLLLLTDALLRFGGGGPRAVVSLLNVVLIFVPLVSLILGTMYLYGAREFIELLLAQPVQRGALFLGLYGGLALPLVCAFVVGVGLPFVWSGGGEGEVGGPLAILFLTGILLTLAFTALAFLISLLLEDRAKGLGVAILFWLSATALYDAFLVLVITLFADYPLERPLIGLILLNPIDLGRVLLLLRLDTAALMGYTGAVFERFFGSLVGFAVAGGALLAWTALPLGLGFARFRAKDF
ncbi:MAG TPA: ABC transporter permease subunit [Gemmatimonadales bacterium]|jgi:Cu-processing system permease protein|nr:ABC transporter permease subunit [Gemmatimonadales bacterium]